MFDFLQPTLLGKAEEYIGRITGTAVPFLLQALGAQVVQVGPEERQTEGQKCLCV